MNGMKQFLSKCVLAGIFITLTAILVLSYLLHISTTNNDAQSKLWWWISGGCQAVVHHRTLVSQLSHRHSQPYPSSHFQYSEDATKTPPITCNTNNNEDKMLPWSIIKLVK